MTTTTARTSIPLRALRWTALLTTLNLVCQGATAGELLMHSHTGRELHESGAIVLHVLSFLAAASAFWYWRGSGHWIKTATLSGLVFVVSFIVPLFGHGRTLYLHVPLAMLLLLGAAWVTARAWLPTREA